MTATFVGSAALVMAVVLAGCTSSPHGPPATTVPRTVPTTVAATATITGTLEAVGGPPGSADRPLPGNVTASRNGHSYPVAVGGDGRYSISVAPGSYTMVGRSPQYQGGSVGCHAAGPVAVAAGGTATADVFCQER